MKKLITDKTLAAFEKWFYENHGKCSKKFEELLTWEKSEIMDYLFNACETIQHAFLIEFFDSVGIKIGFIPIQGGDLETYLRVDKYEVYNIDHRFDSRQEAKSKAFEKANEIFNNR